MTTVELAERLGLQREMVVEKVTTRSVVDGKEVSVEVERLTESDRFSNDVLMDLFKLQMQQALGAAPYVAQKVSGGGEGGTGPTLNVSFAQLSLGGKGVSVPARGEDAGQDFGGGMSVRLGQVGREKSDDQSSD